MAAVLLLAIALPGCPPPEPPRAKYFILFIGDGMHLQHEIAASRYLTGTDDGLSFHDFPYQGAMTTWGVRTYDQFAWFFGADRYDPDSFNPRIGYDPALGGVMPDPLDTSGAEGYFLNQLDLWGGQIGALRPATDSAAAATAMATGVKTDPGKIAWRMGDPVDGAIPSFGERLRAEKGAHFAVASTVPFSHATPAAWGAHGPDRGDYLSLADGMLRDVQPDVVIGGGHPLHYQWPESGYVYAFLSEMLYSEMAANTPASPYVFAERRVGTPGEVVLAEGFAAARETGKKLFALFGGAGGSFETPLAQDGEVRVERSTDLNPLLRHVTSQTLEHLRATSSEAGFFVLFEQGDIDWANHSNDYAWMISTVWDLDEAVRAACAFVDEPGDDMNWTNTLMVVTADHANSFMRLTDNPRLGQGDLPEQVRLGKAWEYLFRYPGGEVTYGTNGHTNEPVRIYAKGAAASLFAEYEGRWYPGTRLIDNTHLHAVFERAAGL